MDTNIFEKSELSEDVLKRIRGKSFPAHAPDDISANDLAYLKLSYYDFENEVQQGEMICNKKVADDLLEIFQELFRQQYQIERIRLIDEYDADDERSMADNNTSAFNYRFIYGTQTRSNHSYGMAVDVNPLYNPYISYHDGKEVIQPANSLDYVEREKEFPHKITHDDLCYKLFIAHGFTWGGDWEKSKDYQHFEHK